MAVPVVDQLEVVDVHQDQRDTIPVPSVVSELKLQQLITARMIVEPSNRSLLLSTSAEAFVSLRLSPILVYSSVVPASINFRIRGVCGFGRPQYCTRCRCCVA